MNTRFTAIRAQLEALEFKNRPQAWAFEFLLFGFKQGWACLFGGLVLALLLATHLFYPADAPLARYDFLVIACVAIQAAMLAFRLETMAEARVILAFHVVGTLMEIFKVHMGSWTYPEPSVLRLFGVPLFSGFMYAAVGSFLARVWRIFDFRFTNHPPLWATGLLALGIYINFFTHHFLPDARWPLIGIAGLLFARAIVWFTPYRTPRPMPLLLGFLLVALFIWFAENLATFANAWIYPHQAGAHWTPVKPTKLVAWFLLMLISYVLVSAAHGSREAPSTRVSFPPPEGGPGETVPIPAKDEE